MKCLLQCNLLSGDGIKYVMNTWMRIGPVVCCKLLFTGVLNNWHVTLLFHEMIIMNMQLHPIHLHTNLNCVPIPEGKI